MNIVKQFLLGGRGTTGRIGDLALAVMRVSLATFMVVGHGWGKLYQSTVTGVHVGPPQGFVDAVASMGFPVPVLFAWLATLAETLVAVLLGLGLFTRPAALILVFNMGVAAFVAHGGDPWFMTGQGTRAKEMAMLYLLPFLLFMVIGAGNLSLDAFIRGKQTLPSESLPPGPSSAVAKQ